MKLREIKPDLLDLLESIYVAKDNKLSISSTKGRDSSMPGSISTSFRRIPYKTSIKGSEPIYSVLNYVSDDETTKLLTSLKGKGPYQVNPNQVDHLLQGVTGASKKIFDHVKPDVILYPRSSSDLLKKFVDKLKEAFPGVQVGDETFIKKILKAGDEEALINTSHPDWAKFVDEHPDAADELKKSLKRHIKDGELELKKLYKPYVKFIKNFVEMRDASKTLDDVIGKNVLVVDDVLSSGATMLEMFRQLREFEPENLAGLTIFKRTTQAH